MTSASTAGALAELACDLRGAFAVQVGEDHARPLGRERPGGCTADTAGAAGDEDDGSLELAGRRCERKLVELERPVLDRERLLVVQGDEAPEPGGTSHHGDRAQVEVARELRGLQRPPGLTRPTPSISTTRGLGSSSVSRRPGTARSRHVRAPGRPRPARRGGRATGPRHRVPDRTRHTRAAAWCARDGRGTRRRPARARANRGRRRIRSTAGERST